MGQEFFVKSTTLEDKVRQILPSQGGLGAGFDLSASTQIIPIVDLTESAEGSTLREDLQKSLTHANSNPFSITNATTTIISNTGYWRLFGISFVTMSSSAVRSAILRINDGATTKIVYSNLLTAVSGDLLATESFDFIVKLEAGDSIEGICTVNAGLNGTARQIADIDGTLVNP